MFRAAHSGMLRPQHVAHRPTCPALTASPRRNGRDDARPVEVRRGHADVRRPRRALSDRRGVAQDHGPAGRDHLRLSDRAVGVEPGAADLDRSRARAQPARERAVSQPVGQVARHPDQPGADAGGDAVLPGRARAPADAAHPARAGAAAARRTAQRVLRIRHGGDRRRAARACRAARSRRGGTGLGARCAGAGRAGWAQPDLDPAFRARGVRRPQFARR